jgi:hypothetical protein
MTLHPIPLNFVIFEENLSICSDKCEIVHVFMFEVIFDRNGAKIHICKKSTSSPSEKYYET